MDGGESGIRTHEALLTLTRFPSVRLKPLGHLSGSGAFYSTRRSHRIRCAAGRLSIAAPASQIHIDAVALASRSIRRSYSAAGTPLKRSVTLASSTEPQNNTHSKVLGKSSGRSAALIGMAIL